MNLKQQRKEIGLTQVEMASFFGIKQQDFSDIEKGKQKITVEQEQYLMDLESFMKMNMPLELKFDYVRIRFETIELQEIINHVLMLDLDWIEAEDHGWYGYKQHIAFGHIIIMYDVEDVKLGILIELKGGGCRHFEQILQEQNRTWHDFFTTASKQKAIIKRIDLAVDDKSGILDIPFFIEKMKHAECETDFRRFNVFANAENKNGKMAISRWGQHYISGQEKSTIYFCLYEKDYEQYVKTGIEPRFHRVRNRLEIRLKDERAENAIKHYVRRNNLEIIAFGIIEKYICFKDVKRGIKLKDCPVNKRWELFMQHVREEMRLTNDPEEMTLEKTWQWVEKQVAPTLKVLKYMDAQRLDDTVEEATLSTKQKNILKTHDKEIEEVVI